MLQARPNTDAAAEPESNGNHHKRSTYGVKWSYSSGGGEQEYLPEIEVSRATLAAAVSKNISLK